MIVKTVSEARAELSDLLGKVQHGKEEVTILRHGKPAGVMISMEAYAFLEEMEDEMLARMGDAAYAQYLADPSKAKTIEQVRAELLGPDAAE